MDIPEKIDWKREKICFLGASGELSIFVEALHNSCNFLGNFHGSEVVIYDNETSSTINKNLYELKHIEHRRAQSNLTRDKIFTIKSIDELPEFNNSLGLIPIITSDSYYKIYKEILIKKGYILGQNSFYYRDVYARIVKSIVGEVSLLRIDHAITFSCTLNCSHCNMYIPFIEPSHQHIETLLNDLDLLFRHVKHVGVFHIVGGEMTIHPKLNLYLEKLIYYRDRISQLWISTNGTVMPSKEILDKLKKLNPRLQISDYSEPIPKVASTALAIC